MNEENKLKTIGILSFFSVLNKNREEYKETLKILKEEFDFELDWNLFNDLNSQELVEVHGNEVVKISDSILSTYVFYKTFICENALMDFGKWVEIFIEKYDKEINNKIVDISKIMDSNEFKDIIKQHTASIKDNFQNDNVKSFKFLNIFYFVYPLET